jgi:hypothetical protein
MVLITHAKRKPTRYAFEPRSNVCPVGWGMRFKRDALTVDPPCRSGFWPLSVPTTKNNSCQGQCNQLLNKIRSQSDNASGLDQFFIHPGKTAKRTVGNSHTKKECFLPILQHHDHFSMAPNFPTCGIRKQEQAHATSQDRILKYRAAKRSPASTNVKATKA